MCASISVMQLSTLLELEDVRVKMTNTRQNCGLVVYRHQNKRKPYEEVSNETVAVCLGPVFSHK